MLRILRKVQRERLDLYLLSSKKINTHLPAKAGLLFLEEIFEYIRSKPETCKIYTNPLSRGVDSNFLEDGVCYFDEISLI